MDSGWIKLHRKMLDNPLVCKDADHIAVWVYMLLSATHSPQKMMFGKEMIVLQPGQFISGRQKISDAIKVEENKVYRIMKKFEKQQLIEQQTSTKNTLFTIVNWDEHQNTEQYNEQQVNNNCTTNEQQVNTNKNVRMKECKNERIDMGDKPNRFTPPTVEDVKAYCLEHGYNVDAERFVAFYESNGWKVGKNKMKDWKASARGWHSRNKSEGRYITESKTNFAGEDLIADKMFAVPVFED